jgi:hypothetical protein
MNTTFPHRIMPNLAEGRLMKKASIIADFKHQITELSYFGEGVLNLTEEIKSLQQKCDEMK